MQAGENVHVEGSIDHGSWQAVDALEKITVHNASNEVLGERAFSSDSGVKTLSFNITKGDSGLEWNAVDTQ